MRSISTNSIGRVFLYLVAYLSFYHEKAINVLFELAEELPAICLPHQDGGIPLSAAPNGITSKLAGLLSILPFNAERQAGKLGIPIS